jgi:hypothetical protein
MEGSPAAHRIWSIRTADTVRRHLVEIELRPARFCNYSVGDAVSSKSFYNFRAITLYYRRRSMKI